MSGKHPQTSNKTLAKACSPWSQLINNYNYIILLNNEKKVTGYRLIC